MALLTHAAVRFVRCAAPRRAPRRWCVRLALTVVALLSLPAASAEADPSAIRDVPDDLTEVSLEALSEIKITSVARKQQSLANAAAAVYVVTADDIRRSGATSLPDALRLVPGVHVAQIDANKWSVSARGFSGRWVSNLLVLIDGRTVYTPLFPGVFWEMLDIPMENIDRIEVVRGPGATMWGTNAVNGVVNVITKSARDTQGGMMTLGAGTLDGALTSLRYGAAVGKGFFRVHAKYHDRNSSPGTASDGLPEPRDEWGSTRGGFRLELPLGRKDELLVQGGIHQTEGFHRRFQASLQERANVVDIAGLGGSTSFLSGGWRREFSDRSELTLSGYFDSMDRREVGIYDVSVKSTKVDLQHRFSHSSRAELTYGVAYRSVWSDLSRSDLLRPSRPQRRVQYTDVFAQEEIQPIRDRLFVTIGGKLEENSLGGLVFQPTARVLWTPNDRFSSWAAVSRAARSPVISELDLRFDVSVEDVFGNPALVALLPNPDQRNMLMTAYEAGVRFTPVRRLSFDVALFRSRYSSALSLSTGDVFIETSPEPVHAVIPIQFGNEGVLCTHGAEVVAQWRPRADWRLTGTYSYLEAMAHSGGVSQGVFDDLVHIQSPANQASLRSSWILPGRLELDVSAAYFDSTVAAGVHRRGERFPAYLRFDARTEWRANERLRLSFGVRNLFDPDRIEFDPESLSVSSPVGRNVYGRAVWSF